MVRSVGAILELMRTSRLEMVSCLHMEENILIPHLRPKASDFMSSLSPTASEEREDECSVGQA